MLITKQYLSHFLTVGHNIQNGTYWFRIDDLAPIFNYLNMASTTFCSQIPNEYKYLWKDLKSEISEPFAVARREYLYTIYLSDYGVYWYILRNQSVALAAFENWLSCEFPDICKTKILRPIYTPSFIYIATTAAYAKRGIYVIKSGNNLSASLLFLNAYRKESNLFYFEKIFISPTRDAYLIEKIIHDILKPLKEDCNSELIKSPYGLKHIITLILDLPDLYEYQWPNVVGIINISNIPSISNTPNMPDTPDTPDVSSPDDDSVIDVVEV
ncbi:putative BRO-like protein 2 [Diachasmimorpha longicaudata entomopoxvirus]|uniref:Putative BRO-like protein 2 n=1 Tax=Diachasmimorpha longicaudata entomopoxvirus TaxID=109981 RepID=A0A7R5WML2_9POXV|nr:putative BRO-like protein 2 [Diachasmimorpha longicaudata entomopoxvirus]AKS26414.1 putative BRO-like protein 2 [Diachasmimorpha longicaudata entomopoxvirus]